MATRDCTTSDPPTPTPEEAIIKDIQQRMRAIRKLKRIHSKKFTKDLRNRYLIIDKLTEEVELHMAKAVAFRSSPRFGDNPVSMLMAAVTFNAERRLEDYYNETNRLEIEFRRQQLQYSQELLELLEAL